MTDLRPKSKWRISKQNGGYQNKMADIKSNGGYEIKVADMKSKWRILNSHVSRDARNNTQEINNQITEVLMRGGVPHHPHLINRSQNDHLFKFFPQRGGGGKF